MRTARQIILGLIIALASGGIILGAFFLSFAEGQSYLSVTASPVISSPTWVPSFTPTPGSTNTPILVTPTWTLTPPATPVNCPVPQGWVPYLVQPGDTLDLLAQRHHVTARMISDANCLLTTAILPGGILYVPPVPTATVLVVPCGPPYRWVTYMVMPGDNLYRLSQSYGITVSELQKANCMGGSDLIRVGQIIYVPWWAPHTPTPTLIYPATDTPFVIPTDTPLVTPSETPTEPTPSDTPIPSDTPTLVPTDTPIILPTDTPLPIVNP